MKKFYIVLTGLWLICLLPSCSLFDPEDHSAGVDKSLSNPKSGKSADGAPQKEELPTVDDDGNILVKKKSK